MPHRAGSFPQASFVRGAGGGDAAFHDGRRLGTDVLAEAELPAEVLRVDEPFLFSTLKRGVEARLQLNAFAKGGPQPRIQEYEAPASPICEAHIQGMQFNHRSDIAQPPRACVSHVMCFL